MIQLTSVWIFNRVCAVWGLTTNKTIGLTLNTTNWWIGCHDRTYYKLLTQLACSDITLSGVRWLSAHNVSVFLLARFQVKSSKIIENGFGFWNTCKVPVIFFFVGFFSSTSLEKNQFIPRGAIQRKFSFFWVTVWTLIKWLLVLRVSCLKGCWWSALYNKSSLIIIFTIISIQSSFFL